MSAAKRFELTVFWFVIDVLLAVITYARVQG